MKGGGLVRKGGGLVQKGGVSTFRGGVVQNGGVSTFRGGGGCSVSGPIARCCGKMCFSAVRACDTNGHITHAIVFVLGPPRGTRAKGT